ncbi:MAG: DMT family transporter [Alphaproteobacteria bacterium]|nr:DMT family transporter [Alphaproteobacteria bacterium]
MPSARTTAAPPSDAPVRGVLLMCLAVLMFNTMNVIIKSIYDLYPITQMVWLRYGFHFLFVVALFAPHLGRLFRTYSLKVQVLRGALVVSSAACMFTGIGLMPLATAVSITFISPLIVVALSMAVLGERVTWDRWIAVTCGFVGILVIIRPDFGGGWAVLLPICSAVLYAIYQIITRRIAMIENPYASTVYPALCGAIALSVVQPFEWVTPQPVHWLLFVVCGVLGAAGHFFVVQAYARAHANVVAPFIYTEILGAMVWGYVVFHELPDAWTFIGAAIVAASGIWVVLAERRLQAATRQA